MASAEDDLQCGLCLNTYKSPKFLPCHHTFCQGCIEGLVKNTSDSPLKCPKCRQVFRLPAGGVSELQTNYYILPLLSPERCTLHRTETLRFYCTDCKIPICSHCRMTDHFKHEAQDLGKVVDKAREELKECQERLGEGQTTVSQQQQQVQHCLKSQRDRQEVLERQVQQRADSLKRHLNSMVTSCSEEVMTEIGAAFSKLQRPLQENQQRVENNMSALQALQQEVTQALENNVTHSLLTLSADMRTGRGSRQQLRQLTSDLPGHTQRAVLRYDDNFVQRDVIRQYLGRVDLFQPVPLQQSVMIRGEFRCCQDPQLYVHAIYFNDHFSHVEVAYGASGKRGEGWVVIYSLPNTLIGILSEAITGRVCFGGLNYGWVRVEGNEFPAKDLLMDSIFSADNKAIQRKYDVYNKGDARFVLRVHQSGLCDLRAVSIEDYTVTIESTVCEVSAKTPIAMDVSKDGQLIAVLEEGLDHVMLYRQGNTEPHATYRGNGEAFRPLDVCFYVIGGEEQLVIADWLNDVLHVVEVGESCTLIGHMGRECPEMVKPTALFAEKYGGLWVGCQGGRVFKLRETTLTTSDSEADSSDESDTG